MDSSEFLRISGKGGGGFEWTGSAKDLNKFFSALGYRGTWSQPTGEGHHHKFADKMKMVTCTWYDTPKSKTLLIQGKKASELKDKLRQVLVDPDSLIAAKDESETERTESDSLEDDGSEVKSNVASGVHESNEFNEDEIHDGLNPGKLRIQESSE